MNYAGFNVPGVGAAGTYGGWPGRAGGFESGLGHLSAGAVPMPLAVAKPGAFGKAGASPFGKAGAGQFGKAGAGQFGKPGAGFGWPGQ